MTFFNDFMQEMVLMSLLIGNFFFWENNQYTMWPKAIWSHSSIPNIYSDYPPLRSTETFENFNACDSCRRPRFSIQKNDFVKSKHEFFWPLTLVPGPETYLDRLGLPKRSRSVGSKPILALPEAQTDQNVFQKLVKKWKS